MRKTNESHIFGKNRAKKLLFHPMKIYSAVLWLVLFLSMAACSGGGGSNGVADLDDDEEIRLDIELIELDKGDKDDEIPDTDLDLDTDTIDSDEEGDGILPESDIPDGIDRIELEEGELDIIDVPEVDQNTQCVYNDDCSDGQYCEAGICYDYPTDGDDTEAEEDASGCENDDEVCLLCGEGSAFCEKNSDCPARMWCDSGAEYGCCRPGPCYEDGQDYCDERYPDDDYCCLDLNGQCGLCPTGDEEIVFHCLTSQDCIDNFGGGPWWCDADSLECVPSECSFSSDCPNGPCLGGVCIDNSEIETTNRGIIKGRAYYNEPSWGGRGDVSFELRDAYYIEDAELVLVDDMPVVSEDQDFTLEYYFTDLPEGVYYAKIYTHGGEMEYYFNPITVDYSNTETTVYTDIDFYLGLTPPYTPTIRGYLQVAPELAERWISVEASYGRPFSDGGTDDIAMFELGEYDAETGRIPFEEDELDPGHYYLRARYYEEQRGIVDYLSTPITLDQENPTAEDVVLYVGVQEESLGTISGTVVTAPEFDLMGVEVILYNSTSYDEILASAWAEQIPGGDYPTYTFEAINLESGTYYPRAYVNRYQRFQRIAQTLGEPEPLVIDLDQGTDRIENVDMYSTVPLDGVGSIKGGFTYEYSSFQYDSFVIEAASDAAFTQDLIVEEPIKVTNYPKRVTYFIPNLDSGDYYLRYSVDHDGSYCGVHTVETPVSIDATDAENKDVVLPDVSLQEDFCNSF